MAPRRPRKRAAPTVEAENVADSAAAATDEASTEIDEQVDGKSGKKTKSTKTTTVSAVVNEKSKKAAAPKKNAEQAEQNGGASVEDDVAEPIASEEDAKPKESKQKKVGASKRQAKTIEQKDYDAVAAASTTNGDSNNGDAPDEGKKPVAKGKQKKNEPAPKGKSKKTDQKAVDENDDEPEAGPSTGDKKNLKDKSAKKNDAKHLESVHEAAFSPIASRIRRGAKKIEAPKKPVEIKKPVESKAKKAETAKTSAKASKSKQKVEESTDDSDDVEEKVAPAKGRKRAAAAEKSPAKKEKHEAAADAENTSKGKANGTPKKRKAGVKAAADSTTIETGGELVTKRKKASKTDAAGEDKTNPTSTDLSKIDFEIDNEYSLKIVSWNVAGLRALIAKNGFDYFEYEKPDIICLQEIKCLEEEVPEAAKLKGYHPYWCSTTGGRGGVAILSKHMPYSVEQNLDDEEMDKEGRIITAEYSKFYLVCVYVPNAGSKLVNLDRRLRWNQLFDEHITELKAKKPVIICGDMNVAHEEIDLANPKTNTKNAGFSQQERDGMTDLLKLGFVDTFRELNPKKDKAYTFWTYMGGARQKNVGWRLDYAIVSESLKSKVVDSFMRPQILGSDHCPIVLLMNI